MVNILTKKTHKNLYAFMLLSLSSIYSILLQNVCQWTIQLTGAVVKAWSKTLLF